MYVKISFLIGKSRVKPIHIKVFERKESEVDKQKKQQRVNQA